MGRSSINMDLFYSSVVDVGEHSMWLYGEVGLVEGKV